MRQQILGPEGSVLMGPSFRPVSIKPMYKDNVNSVDSGIAVGGEPLVVQEMQAIISRFCPVELRVSITGA